MNPMLLTGDGYTMVRALQIFKKIKINFVTVAVQKELLKHDLAVLDGGYLGLTELGMKIPRILRAA